VSGNVYAAWSDFKGSGCNEILFSRSTNHGATFSKPLKISSRICGNQGPSIAIGPSGKLYIGWEANTIDNTRKAVTGARFTASSDSGKTFSNARIVLTYSPFTSEQFSDNGARECGDAPFNCPNGVTFPRLRSGRR
jgi:hypothetical protein